MKFKEKRRAKNGKSDKHNAYRLPLFLLYTVPTDYLPYLRKTGYEVMQSYVMHKPANDPIFTFIEKKRGEGKSGKLAMVAGLNKFLRVYYGKVTELYRSLPTIE